MNGVDLAKVAMEPAKFARGVVDNALRHNSNARFWYGAKSWMVWFLTTFFGHTFFVGFVHLVQLLYC